MLPKEHGAYGQLLFPIATALAIGHPGITAAALAGAAVGVFLAHEPLLVLLGLRGSHAARSQRSRAMVWFASCASLAVVAGIIALYTASPAARIALVAPAFLALLLSIVIVTGREHTVGGELLSAITLASMAYPVGIASLASSRASLSCAAAFAATFSVGIVGVHAVIGFTRHPPALGERIAGAVAALAAPAICWLLGVFGKVEGIAPMAAAPGAIACLFLVLRPPSARKLRMVGWTLVTTSTLTTAALIAVFR